MVIASEATGWITTFEQGLEGEENMRRDVAMATASDGDGRRRLRFYTWDPWTLSLGHNQRDDGIDLELLRQRGWGLVRRPTGGRAVFHAEELTYAVAMPAEGAGVHTAYAAITEAIRAGLEELGATDLAFSRTQPDFRSHYGTDESASCFSVSALNELTWKGRKLLGSAQRRYGNVLLQHGSLLLGEAHLDAIDILHPALEAERREALRDRLRSRTATLEQVFEGALPPLEMIVQRITEAFERLLPYPTPSTSREDA